MTAERPQILLVDDTPANLLALRRLLADCDAELVEATNGNQALALCLGHRFALILLDVNMPGMDGFEVAELLADAEHLRETPIIFVTAAYADDMNRLKGYHAGAVDYIAKPINDVILRAKVRVFLELHQARMELQQALAELGERNRALQAEIAERQRVEAQVRHLATHDPLTGLPNRVLFQDRLRQAMASAPRGPQPFVLALLDLDGFKAVNDTHGHPAGDALLKAVAERLRDALRASDTVARLGGDEFALIFDGTTGDAPLRERCAVIGARLAQPYLLPVDGQTVEARISASIGIAPWQADTASDEALIQAADSALYAAKRAGKNRCAFA